MKEPLKAAKLIGDKLIRETPFAYRLEVANNCGIFDRIHFVDFGRTFGLGRPAVAYAWTRLTAAKAGKIKIEIEHSDGCKIWLNGKKVYSLAGKRNLNLRRDERSFETSYYFVVELNAGPNALLIKSETRGNEWRVYLQPPSHKGAVVNGALHPEIGLRGVPNVDEKIAELTNWLVIGKEGGWSPGSKDRLAEGSYSVCCSLLPVFGHLSRCPGRNLFVKLVTLGCLIIGCRLAAYSLAAFLGFGGE